MYPYIKQMVNKIRMLMFYLIIPSILGIANDKPLRVPIVLYQVFGVNLHWVGSTNPSVAIKRNKNIILGFTYLA